MDHTLSGKGLAGLCVVSISLSVLFGVSERRRKPLRSIVYWSSGYALESLPECGYPFLGSAYIEDPEALSWWTPERRAAQREFEDVREARERVQELKEKSEMAAEKAPGGGMSPRLRAKLLLANQLLTLGDIEGALGLYEELTRKGGGPFIETRRIDCLLRLGRVEDAVDILDTLSIRYENAPIQLLMLAPLYLRSGRAEKGERLFRRAIELEPKTKTAQLEFGRYLASTGRLEEAKEFYELYLSVPVQAQSLRIHLELASLLERLGNVRSATQKLESLSRLQPRNKKVQIRLASLLLQQDRYDEAKAALKRVLGADPFDEGALRLMAIAFLSQGRHEEATQYLQYLLHRHPRNPSGLSLLGDIAYDRGDLEKAEAMYREALALSPSLHGVCNNLAWLLLRSGRPEEAKGYAMQATAFAPQNASYYDTLAKILEELGDQQAADSAADKARELLALESPEAEK